MLKINDTKYQTMVVRNGSPSDLEAGRRLIVPISNPDADLTDVIRRVWKLANETGARVLLLGLCNETKNEPALRRALATTSALVNSGNVIAEAEIAYGRNWKEAVTARLQAGDTVICWHGQQAEFDVPVYFLSKLYSRNTPRPNWLGRVAVWLGSIAILIGFFFVQVQIVRVSEGLATTVLQLLSMAGEMIFILFWNSLFG